MSDDSSVDVAALDRLARLGGNELVCKMIDLFLENAARRIEAAAAGVKNGDLAAVEAAAHSLKATAANVGAARLQELARRVEELAVADDAAAVADLVHGLERDFQQVRARLERERRGLGGSLEA